MTKRRSLRTAASVWYSRSTQSTYRWRRRGDACAIDASVVALLIGTYQSSKAYTKKVLVSGREAPENLTRSVGLFFYFGLFFLFFAVH